MFTKNCTNCAWFCHSDRKCYGNPFMLSGNEIGAELIEKPEMGCCTDWTSDGLSDEERASFIALVTMEATW